jgi:hypothetical protein
VHGCRRRYFMHRRRCLPNRSLLLRRRGLSYGCLANRNKWSGGLRRRAVGRRHMIHRRLRYRLLLR